MSIWKLFLFSRVSQARSFYWKDSQHNTHTQKPKIQQQLSKEQRYIVRQ